MGTKGTSEVEHDLKLTNLTEALFKECRVMADYAMANGKPLDFHQVAPLDKGVKKLTANELIPVYNYLLMLVKPAKPSTLVLFEKNRQSTNRFKFFGPLPIIRRFMLLAIVSLLALIGFSLSKDVNATSIELSMLQGYGWDQALRLGFLLAASSLGASFYALFRMNHFISEGTFDMKYASTYWGRYVVGLLAGIFLSEFFIVFINPDAVVTVDKHVEGEVGLSEDGILSTTRYLLKPILAILGGFSANLVYRILNRLVEALESLFKGSAEERINRAQTEVMSQSQDALNQVRNDTANRLVGIKNELLGSGVSPNLLASLDEVTGGLVPNMVPPGTPAVSATVDTTETVTEEEVEVAESTEVETTTEDAIQTDEGKDNSPPPPASW